MSASPRTPRWSHSRRAPAGDWEELGAGESLPELVVRAAVTTPLSDGTDVRAVTAYRIAFDSAVVADELVRRSTTPLRFFDDLVAWQRSGALTDIHLVLRKDGVPGVLTHRDLSDGEYAYLTRYALMHLALGVSDGLLLLDEVENHFNAVWCMDLVANLVALGGRRSSSELWSYAFGRHADGCGSCGDRAFRVRTRRPAGDDDVRRPHPDPRRLPRGDCVAVLRRDRWYRG